MRLPVSCMQRVRARAVVNQSLRVAQTPCKASGAAHGRDMIAGLATGGFRVLRCVASTDTPSDCDPPRARLAYLVSATLTVDIDLLKS